MFQGPGFASGRTGSKSQLFFLFWELRQVTWLQGDSVAPELKLEADSNYFNAVLMIK